MKMGSERVKAEQASSFIILIRVNMCKLDLHDYIFIQVSNGFDL